MALALAICPVCHTAAAQPQDTCLGCGLVFASLPDGATPVRACIRCGAAARPGARICGYCGDSLPFTYAPLMSGQVLASGRYTILRPLSRGGMSTLYLATEHGAIDRTVVIKALLDYFDRTNPHEWDTARTRFLQEAQTLAALRHPAIPRIFTSFRDGPHVYISMEYIAGHDLEQGLTHTDDPSGRVVTGQPYALEDVLRWGVALCRVLEYLASRAPEPVVHQDIKPANIVVSRGRDDIFLVDFGTARVSLVPQAGDTVLLRQPSVYGTVGYAPPEQYRGQSEPRSDVYALAATLYHLATDDDPRQHPFVFARLDQLGGLGQVLGGALQQDALGRPDAAHFRGQLEALLGPGGAPVYAPDGVALVNPVQLVDWCEQHWLLAAGWLYDKLPYQIAVWWGQPDLRNALDEVVARHADQDVGLDAALALLDPQGFGAAVPQLAADQPALDFGRLPARTTSDRSLLISNVGRRYVRAQLQGPGWMNVVLSSVSLPPGSQASLHLAADIGRPASGRRLRGEIQARDAADTLLSVEALAFRSLWLALWRRTADGTVSVYQALRSPWLALWQRAVGRVARAHRARSRRTAAQLRLWYALIVTVLTLSLAGLWAGYNFYWEEYKSAHYIAGLSALVQEDWTRARAEFERVLAVQPDFTDTPKLLRESYSRPLLAAIEAGQWDRAAQAFITMEYHGLASPDLSAKIAATPEMAPALIRQRGAAWQSGKLQLVNNVPGGCASAYPMAVSSDQRTFVTVDHSDNPQFYTIYFCNVADGTLTGTYQGKGTIGNFIISPDGQRLVAFEWAGVVVQRASNSIPIGKLPKQGISAIAFMPDGQTLVSGDNTGVLDFWRMSDTTLFHSLKAQGDGIQQIVISPDGQVIASTSYVGELGLWRVSDSKRLYSVSLGWQYRPDPLGKIAFLPDGQGIVSFYGDTITIRRIDVDEIIRTITLDKIYDMTAISPDGRTLATGQKSEFGDDMVSLWRLDNGALIQKVRAGSNIRALAFTPDGRYLVSSSANEGVKIWSPAP